MLHSTTLQFKREAKQVSSTTIISHIRHATTGPKVVENCHPFTMDGRVFAHNGVLGGLDRLEARLGEDLALVKGQTDSERWFALITREIRKAGGDIRAGITAAARWVAAELPVCSINFVLATPNELWAFRYPETDRLYVLDRPAGGPAGDRAMHYVSPAAARPLAAPAGVPDRSSWRANASTITPAGVCSGPVS